MVSTVYWEIHTSEQNYFANSITADWPNLTIGERATIRVHFHDDGTLTVANGETHTVTSDTAEFYETTTVESGGTLTQEDGSVLVTNAEENRWNSVESWTDYAGQAARGAGLNNVPWFVEQLPADARVDSIVLGFEPSAGLAGRNVRGFWGLLVGGRDERNTVLSRHDLELELVVLDEFGQYADVSAVKSDLEA